jgi:hypothetical protein
MGKKEVGVPYTPKYERDAHRFGSSNCRCTRTGPENTYSVSEECPLHCEQTFTGEDPPEATSYRPPPSHYAGGGGIDPWAFIDAQGLDYWQGNVIKYVTRAGRKEIASRLEDLMKARDFLNYMIAREERNARTP